MRPFLSKTMKDMIQSDIRRMTRECNRVDGINLGQGVCNMPTPPRVREGAIRAIEERKSTYSLAEGIPELRQAIAQKLRRENGIEADPDAEISVSVGTSGAYSAVLLSLLDPGDGILVFEPYYGYHVNGAILAGLELQYCTLTPPDFAVTEEGIAASLKPNTRAMVICTPSNPSGKMFSKEELECVARVASERDLLVISDEIYEYFRYDGNRHVSAATVGGLRERTVTLMGYSKTFSITGWRLGYAVAPASLCGPITLATDLLYVCAPTPLQYGALGGMASGDAYFDGLREDFQAKRDRFCSALDRAGLRPIVPQGSYYVLADVSSLDFPDSHAAAMHVLETTGIASIPGRAFYRSSVGEGLIRFCFSVEDDVLDEACRRIERFGSQA
jgi:aminotransferase